MRKEKIWTHGAHCECEYCENEKGEPSLTFDAGPDGFADFEMPKSGEIIQLEDQNGGSYYLWRL